ncbi:Canalicular multispecific organic anion transporter 1 [Halocaridina rubra]|uniref:Canalicular multispecific organic anion transporter 1 n=1 Tax=Halocaridina rubra TaxID=373956 RepID=A0AAN8WS66_HALRR
MNKFLSSSELESTAVCSDRTETSHIAIHNGRFSWEGPNNEAEWSFHDVNLRVQRGTFVAVVGAVGSGKSSLISALLGEMRKENGNVVINGSIAYVSQQAWLQNSTIRDNITWGQPYDDRWYHRVVKACALLPDLDILPDGDFTVVGEKGISLSGGQKQRISVARAVYRDAEIVLLDDPLSAVDAHVGKTIFEEVLGPNGLLKAKTRLLVTHAVTFLPKVDEVIVVKDGQLVEKGTYSELVAADGEFAQFILQYLKSCEEKDAEEDILELCDQLEGVAKGNFLRQISHLSSASSCNSVVR